MYKEEICVFIRFGHLSVDVAAVREHEKHLFCWRKVSFVEKQEKIGNHTKAS